MKGDRCAYVAGPKARPTHVGRVLFCRPAIIAMKHPIAIEFPRQLRASLDEPSADALTFVVAIVRPMDHGMRRARPHQGFPGSIWIVERMAQVRRVQMVAERKVAAVPVQQRVPVCGRVEHVAHLVRPLAERKLDDDGAGRRKRLEKAIHRWSLFAGVHAVGRRGIAAFGSGAVHPNWRGKRLHNRKRRKHDGDRASAAEAALERSGAQPGADRQEQHHEHRKAGRHAKPVESRDVPVEEVVRPSLADEPSAASDLRPERHEKCRRHCDEHERCHAADPLAGERARSWRHEDEQARE